MLRPGKSILSKILLIPIVGTVSLLISLAINTSTTQENQVLLEDAELTQFPLLQLAEKNLVQLQRIKETLSSAVTTGDEDVLNQAQQISESLQADLDRAKRIAPGLKREIEPVADALNGYVTAAYKVSHQMIEGTVDFSNLGTIIEEMNGNYDTAEAGLTKFRDDRLSNFTTAIRDAKENADSAVYYAVAVGIITIIMLFGAAIPISRGIVSSVNSVVSSLRDIAQEDGDLTIRLKHTSKDEIGDLVYWFNTFIDKLQNVIGQIVSTVSPLSDLANTLNNFVDDTMTTVETQRRNAHEVEESAVKINNSVSEISDNAENASNTASETSVFAEEGHKSIQNTVRNIDALSRDISASAETISELEQTAKSVSLVIGVIKNIAEQTNLLALNAAIEAARAGEQGRGFAVVADEVRSLASKTQQSTDEIQETIEALESGTEKAVLMMQSSTEKTSYCVESINEAGSRFQAIMSNITQNREINTQIAKATNAQHSLSNMLQQRAGDISSGADSSHKSTTQLAVNIKELAELTQSLKAVADQFKV